MALVRNLAFKTSWSKNERPLVEVLSLGSRSSELCAFSLSHFSVEKTISNINWQVCVIQKTLSKQSKVTYNSSVVGFIAGERWIITSTLVCFFSIVMYYVQKAAEYIMHTDLKRLMTLYTHVFGYFCLRPQKEKSAQCLYDFIESGGGRIRKRSFDWLEDHSESRFLSMESHVFHDLCAVRSLERLAENNL